MPSNSAARRRAPVNLLNGRWTALAAAGLAVGGLALFFLARNLLHHVLSGADPFRIGVIHGLAFGFAVAFAWVGYANVPALLARLTRFSALGVFVYLLVEPPVITLANPDAANLYALLDRLYWPSLAAAALAVWRPSFAILPVMLVLATRDTVGHISGIGMSTLDVRYMMEMMLVLSGAASLIGAFARRLPPEFRDELATSAGLVAVGMHLANYFWSGLAKLWLGPELWSWALENVTPNVMPVALDRGVLPSGPYPWLTQQIYDGFSAFYPVSNVLVLAVQLAAIVAVLRVAWLRLATLAYDALHLGIWLFGGLFFWTWIWNNLSILVALRGERDGTIGPAPKLACILVILLGGPHQLGSAARLAWWDVPDIKHSHFEVRTGDDGEWIRVPLSFWMSHSYSISHDREDLAHTEGHYSPTIWGSATGYERNGTAGTCPPPGAQPDDGKPETEAERHGRLARVAAFVRAHHAKMLASRRVSPGVFGIPWFYLRSHHHPSIPALHVDFNAIDLRDVTHYRLVTQSICLSLRDGLIERRIMKEDDVIFDVR